MNQVLIIAHAPLATALCTAVTHVFEDIKAYLDTLDVPSNQSLEKTHEQVDQALQSALHKCSNCKSAAHIDYGVLVLTDVFGATPCNVVSEEAQNKKNLRLIAGVNLPMLLRALCYKNESLDTMAMRACTGGIQGIVYKHQIKQDKETIKLPYPHAK